MENLWRKRVGERDRIKQKEKLKRGGFEMGRDWLAGI